MKAHHILLFLIFSLQSFPISSLSDNGGLISVNIQNQRLIDEDGRERIFHGTNVVMKFKPYYPIIDRFDYRYSFNEDDAALLKKWGMNVIRLGVMWPGIEYTRGSYNQTYLNIMKKIVDVAAMYGIYTLVDMHQDSFCEKHCGEGVPLWAAQSPQIPDDHGFPEPLDKPYKLDKDGIPTPQDCGKHDWFLYSFTFASSKAVQNLYDNFDGLLDSFIDYWKIIAKLWNGNNWILGYELMNEPWAGDIFSNPSLLLPGVADSLNLQPMYEKLNKGIRQYDNDHLVFFESVTWDNFYVGFNHSPGGDLYRNRSVLAYHVYLPPELSVENAFRARMVEVQKLGCGAFCTETAEREAFYYADQYMQSWLMWAYKEFADWNGTFPGFWYDDGTLNNDTIKWVSRTYASAIAGVGKSMKFDNSTYIFNLQYNIKKSCKLPTEIYLNEDYFYPRGYTVTISPTNVAQWKSPEKNKIYVTASSNTLDGQLISVTINPK
jgi:endoglycosylceramidase